MSTFFILAQTFGVIAWFLLAISYYRENTDKILFVQLLSVIFYCLNYLFLGAFTGIFIIIIELVRDILYYKTDKDDYIFLCTIPLYIILAYLSRNSLVELIPIFASLLEGFTFTKHKKVIVSGALVVYTLWIIYDIEVMSYTGAITDGIIVLSNLGIIINYLTKGRYKRVRNARIIDRHFIKKKKRG